MSLSTRYERLVTKYSIIQDSYRAGSPICNRLPQREDIDMNTATSLDVQQRLEVVHANILYTVKHARLRIHDIDRV